MKILLTGASGFIGNQLASYLSNHRVELCLLVRSPSSQTALQKQFPSASVFHYDFRLEGLVEHFKQNDYSAVVHLASHFVAQHTVSDIDSLVEGNLRLGLHLLEAMSKSSCSKLLNIGTSWQHYQSDSYRPVCLYAATKQAFEDLALYYHDALGVSVTHVKLFDTFGPTDTRNKLIPALFKAAKAGTELSLSPGEQMLDLLYIDDVLEGLWLALKDLDIGENKAWKSFCLSSQKRRSLRELVAVLEDVTKVKLNVRWGARPYREREVMQPWSEGTLVPEWQQRVSLEDGLKKMWKVIEGSHHGI